MDPVALLRELARFDPTLPLDQAATPPASWYVRPELLQRERETVFRHNWLLAARLDQLATSGQYVTGNLAGQPYLVVRTGEGALRAFYNVCRHRAAAVADQQGCLEQFVCPYHGWTYGLDGRLLRAPELGPVKHFDRDAYGLLPLAAESWGNLVFVSFAPPARPLAADLQPLLAQLEASQLDQLRFVARRHYRLACNWKVFVDNYLDGGYHVAHLHRGLAAQLDLAQYRTQLFERFSIQSCGGSKNKSPETASGSPSPDAPQPVRPAAVRAEGTRDFAERIGDEALYAWIYPNLMINRYGPMMDINLVLPQGPDRCEVIFDYYFLEPFLQAEPPQQIERSLAASDVVQQEDVGICESVQRGLASDGYAPGPYSVRREATQYHFHRLLAADLSSEPASG